MHFSLKWIPVILLLAGSAIGVKLAMNHDLHEHSKSENRSYHNLSSRSTSDSPPDIERKIRQKNESAESAGMIEGLLSSGKQEDKLLALESILPALIERDPLAAARVVESLETWAWREDAFHVLARTWSADGPEPAANWAAKLANEAERNGALADIAIEVAKTDPGKALALVMSRGMDDPGNSTFLHLAQMWAAKEPDAAVEWISVQPDRVFKDQAFSRVAISKAAANPADAAHFVMERISPGEVRDEALIAVLHQWISREPAAAQSWVSRFPGGDLKRRAEGEISGFKTYQAVGN